MITNPFHEYKNDYAFDNVYGHTVELLARHLDSSATSEMVHLDVGCGYGSIAEEIVKRLGKTYVGVDANPQGLAALGARGFETHKFILTEKDKNVAFFRKIIGNRTIGSISLLDTLEHLPESDTILDSLYEIAKEHNSLLLVSVPNMQHRDIGFKLALGRLNYTESGLLDHTHVRMFDEKFLSDTLRHSGFHIVDRNDVRLNHSDQFFPSEHPILKDATVLRSFFKNLRAGINDQDQVNQILVACLPGEKINRPAFLANRDVDRPFLSIVTRTQGKRPHCLVEYFTCLAAQTNRDFEVLIVGHKLSVEQQIAVEGLIEDIPLWLREKTRLIRVDHGNRTHPLNVGFENAAGRYIAIQDDDDLPMGNWVEGFKLASATHDGCLLRCVSVLQKVKTVQTNKRSGIRATGPIEKSFPSTFDFIDHFNRNRSPNNTLAFPRGVFHELNMRFDEELTTTEDWDYILRVAAIVGVGSNPDITGIYQWSESANSRTDHVEQEWLANKLRVQQKFDLKPLLLPPGSFRRVMQMAEERDVFGHEAKRFSDLHDANGIAAALRQRLRTVYAILNSTSWKLASPLRGAMRLAGKRASIRYIDCIDRSPDELDEIIRQLYSSRSWQVTAILRNLRKR